MGSSSGGDWDRVGEEWAGSSGQGKKSLGKCGRPRESSRGEERTVGSLLALSLRTTENAALSEHTESKGGLDTKSV